ncbi:phage antirepressor [Globicatella sp. PHS-GS-PNBC-21-1553]|uniref:phage antirepressor n=1 Tax=Globicatella sp. PHS-GS-PNBC-21-1553 TaxID=2885764 RepID=UPI002B324428|nr:phage antirepressor [Globicatella sp. PHS-GS-PNBC-21-1553]
MELQIFKNNEFGEVRTLLINGEPYFVGKDVAEVLGYSNTAKAIRDHVDEEDKLTERIVLAGQNREVIFINESGLYSLILKSKLPTAKQFKRWVTSEVLPTIRKHGVYATDELLDNPDFLIDALQKLKAEREQRLIAEQRVLELQPKASYYDVILQSKSLVSVSQIAKDYGLSATKLNQLLNEWGIQYKQGGTWLLYQKYAPMGYTQSQTVEYNGGEGSRLHTKWTQKGRLFLHNLLTNHGYVPTVEME